MGRRVIKCWSQPKRTSNNSYERTYF
jgi:hypothetical protein